MSIDVSDLRPTVVPKSDQLNAEQLLGGDLTITVTDISVGGGEDQPVSIHYANDAGRPYKPCKTMRKVLILAWGRDGRQWIGKSMTLYNDPKVRFGGMDVGGIRISHVSDIQKEIAVSLTATKGKKAQHVIKALKLTTLAEVLDAIKAATGKEGMSKARTMAETLTSPDDIAAAREAYAARRAELNSKPPITETPEAT